MRLVLVIAALTAGCAGAETPKPAPPSAPSPASVTAAVAAAEAEPAPPMRTMTVETRAFPSDLDSSSLAAPCDFDRSYRGALRSVGTTVVLAPGGAGEVRGLRHDDRPGPSIAVSGRVRPSPGGDRFELRDAAGGVYRGQCDGSGALAGTYRAGGRSEGFVFKPQPATWPPLYRVTRASETLPNHPVCADQAKPDALSEVSSEPDSEINDVVCLPTDPAARKAILRSEWYPKCSVNDVGYRVFGLPSRAVEDKVNAILANANWLGDASDVQICNGKYGSNVSMGLLFASQEWLSVTQFGSYELGGMHPMNTGVGATVIDLVRGEVVKLDDVVTDNGRLRELTARCLPLYQSLGADSSAEPGVKTFESTILPDAKCEDDGPASYLWSCREDDVLEPVWAIMEGGLLIGGRNNPHVSAFLDGHGPILSWDVLLREGLLQRNGPALPLYQSLSTASDDALPCSSSYAFDTINAWREAQPAPVVGR